MYAARVSTIRSIRRSDLSTRKHNRGWRFKSVVYRPNVYVIRTCTRFRYRFPAFSDGRTCVEWKEQNESSAPKLEGRVDFWRFAPSIKYRRRLFRKKRAKRHFVTSTRQKSRTFRRRYQRARERTVVTISQVRLRAVCFDDRANSGKPSLDVYTPPTNPSPVWLLLRASPTVNDRPVSVPATCAGNRTGRDVRRGPVVVCVPVLVNKIREKRFRRCLYL